ncbi:hypothetical protein VTK73DRAFT_2637 [Phialemonium thermophilum]|uniref:Uncharacterized protein n=1 Tax=Phialemonium thermophilum TaxID=223376 RepID=A0ABR3VRB7_9PEZI
MVAWPSQEDVVLRPLSTEVPDKCAADAPVPQTQVAVEERVKDLDLRTVSHVARRGAWYLLGKIDGQTIYGDPNELLLSKIVRVHASELIGFSTAAWARAARTQMDLFATGGRPPLPLKVIEASFEKPQPGKPLEAVLETS